MLKKFKQLLNFIVLFLIYSFILAPLAVVILVSFSESSRIVVPPASFSLKWYANMPKYDGLFQSVKASTIIAVVSSLVTTFIGGITSYALYKETASARIKWLQSFFLLPVVFPQIVLGIALLILFSMIRVSNDWIALIVAHSVLVLPYALRIIGAGFQGISPSLEKAAHTLGASRWKTIWYIFVPNLMPAIFGAFIFGMIVSFTQFTITFFVSSGTVRTLPLWLFNYIHYMFDPGIAAVSTVMIIVMAISAYLLDRLVGVGNLMEITSGVKG
ncbi:MAG: ABC transporter permease [Firmicutes bacterium]|nr:ABC transporter permease [Bacillota bacterium]